MRLPKKLVLLGFVKSLSFFKEGEIHYQSWPTKKSYRISLNALALCCNQSRSSIFFTPFTVQGVIDATKRNSVYELWSGTETDNIYMLDIPKSSLKKMPTIIKQIEYFSDKMILSSDRGEWHGYVHDFKTPLDFWANNDGTIGAIKAPAGKKIVTSRGIVL